MQTVSEFSYLQWLQWIEGESRQSTDSSGCVTTSSSEFVLLSDLEEVIFEINKLPAREKGSTVGTPKKQPMQPLSSFLALQ